jgi:hypothetical protein
LLICFSPQSYALEFCDSREIGIKPNYKKWQGHFFEYTGRVPWIFHKAVSIFRHRTLRLSLWPVRGSNKRARGRPSHGAEPFEFRLIG